MGATQVELAQAIQVWEGTSGITRPRGSAEDVYDAYGNIFTVEKNMGALLGQVEGYSPGGIKDLRRTVENIVGPSYAATVGTLNPQRAVADAVTSIAGERPDDYTVYLSSNAGFQDLFQRAQIALLSPPNPEILGLVTPVSGFGAPLSDAIRENLPEGAITNILANTVDMMGDPALLATLPLFPGGSLAGKALMMVEVSGGMATGEEGAEAVGLPPILGALAGGIAIPTLAGFTRAGFRATLERARANPESGTPATELLRQRGVIITGTDEMKTAVGEAIPAPRVLYRGTSSTVEAQPLGEGAFLTPIKEDAEVYAQATARAIGGEPRVIAVEAAPGSVTPSEIPGLAAERGAVRITQPEGITRIPEAVRVVNPKGIKAISEKDLPILAGSENFLTPQLMDDMIRATLERPEARDMLRKVAETVADTIPGARLVVQAVNRMALAREPWLKGAFGWHLGKSWQDAQRELALASFRAERVPFVENSVGQIWLPRQVGQAVRGLFQRGEGDWIAIGDVFEDVMRGGKTYLPRLTEAQVSWIKKAEQTLRRFTAEAEAAMGQKIATREVYWPRFVKDPTAGRWSVRPGLTGRASPPAFFRRVFEVQEEAISEHGLRYRPGAVNQMDLYVRGMQRMGRDAVLAQYLKREGVLRIGRPTLAETSATEIGPAVRGVVNKEHLREIITLIGPGTRNPLITVPQKVNAVARLLLTGTLDTGWGAIQLMTLPFSPAGPAKWAEAMARGFYDMIVNPRDFYGFLARSPAARRYGMYAGNLGLDSEFFEATRLLGESGMPVVGPAWNVASYPFRAFVRRLQVGFESTLAYGRVFVFDAMADAAARPSVAVRAAGAPARLAGPALHDELFRVARFVDTLVGQPKLAGIISTTQQQFESAWVWFATRYTRSFLGTLSYVAGSGYTPAQARVILAKMLMGGAAIMSGLIAGRGALEGRSREEIINEIATALNPQSGKKFMSMKVGSSWYGMGGVYRSGFAAFAGLADKDNWDFDNWEATTPGGLHLPNGLWDNPIVRSWRARAAPSARLLDFIEGEDFLGYEVDIGRFVDDPRRLGDYAIDNFAPITLDAFLQGHGDWRQRTPQAIAEFFGLRTSPETAFEALEPVRNRVSQELYGLDYDQLEHNRVARQRVNDHPSVVAVLEGRVRPIQDKRVQTAWDKYLEQAEGVRETYGTQKEELDAATRAGRMDGRTYRDEYGSVQSQEFGELTGLQKALGIEFAEGEIPEGTVDAALEAYFGVDLEDYIDPETKEPDWAAFFAAREEALVGLSDPDRADVDWYLRRHETELHRDFRRAFDEIITPSGYMQTREVVARGLGINLDALKEIVINKLQERGLRVAPGDVWWVVDQALEQQLKERLGEDAPSLADIRVTLREANPRLDVELFRQGLVTTVRTARAVEIAQELKQRYPDRAYFVPRLVETD